MARQRKSSGGELRDALSAIVDPLGLVMLTRDRIEDALNDAVSRGRVTADDAQELAATLIERGRHQTNDVLGDIEHALAAKATKAKRVATTQARRAAKGSASAARKTAAKAPASGAAVPKKAPAPKKPTAAKPTSPGIAGYDDLTAKQVQERLAGLTPAKLRRLRDYERAHANRKTVLRAIDQRLK